MRQPRSGAWGAALALTLCLGAIDAACAGDISSVRARAGTLYDFDGIDATSLAITVEPDGWPAILRRDGDLHYEIGILRLPDVDRGKDLYGVHFGPAWEFRPALLGPWGFIELGIGGTWVSGYRIRGRDLGSRLHFVSHAMVGIRPGDGQPMARRPAVAPNLQRRSRETQPRLRRTPARGGLSVRARVSGPAATMEG